MILWLILAAWAAALAFPFLLEALRKPLTAAYRNSAPGDFADLSQGRTHYHWTGPKDGPENAPVAVCVHGLTTPSFVWGPIAGHLAQKGYRVLSYDLYGRGYSDRVKGVQDAEFFLRQLEDLLQGQGVEGQITLLGYSMGGAIGAAFAATHPDRIRQLTLIAPAGFGHDLGPVADVAVRYDWLGRWFMLWLYPKSLRRSIAAERGTPSAIPGVHDLQDRETRMKGFTPAVLASLRGILSADLSPAHAAIAKAGLPVLAIWGERDDVIALPCKDELATRIPQARQTVIPGAGHALAYTHVPEVCAALDKAV